MYKEAAPLACPLSLIVYRSLTVSSEGKAAAIQQARENAIGQVGRGQRNLVLAAVCRAHRGIEVNTDIATQVNAIQRIFASPGGSLRGSLRRSSAATIIRSSALCEIQSSFP